MNTTGPVGWQGVRRVGHPVRQPRALRRDEVRRHRSGLVKGDEARVARDTRARPAPPGERIPDRGRCGQSHGLPRREATVGVRVGAARVADGGAVRHAQGGVVVRRQLKRRYVLAFFKKLPPCLVGIEACATSHHWSRELQAIAQELVRGEYLSRTHVGLDFFDASINRVAAWVVGTRNMLKALLLALLEPSPLLRKLEKDGDFTGRLAMLEELKSLPFAAVWDYHCLRNDVPVGDKWLVSEGLKAGEKVVTDGVLTLRPGAPVVVKSAAAAAAGGVSKTAPLKAESGHDKP